MTSEQLQNKSQFNLVNEIKHTSVDGVCAKVKKCIRENWLDVDNQDGIVSVCVCVCLENCCPDVNLLSQTAVQLKNGHKTISE